MNGGGWTCVVCLATRSAGSAHRAATMWRGTPLCEEHVSRMVAVDLDLARAVIGPGLTEEQWRAEHRRLTAVPASCDGRPTFAAGEDALEVKAGGSGG